MNTSFTKIGSALIAMLCSVGIVAAQTFSPYSPQLSAKGAKQQALAVDASVVLPKGASTFELIVPTPDGGTATLSLEETSVFTASVQARYPDIRTYRGTDLRTGLAAAVTQSALGINAYVQTPGGSYEIVADGPGQAVMGYVNDAALSAPAPALSCGYTQEAHDALDAADAKRRAATGQVAAAKSQVQVNKKLYVMALACTGEFGEANGGTKESVNAVFAEAMNILNAITNRETAVEFQLHPDNDTLIFVTGGGDPYANPRIGRGLLGQNPVAINARIPINQYDIGHVFTVGCTDGIGGVVAGRTCDDEGKARGVTCHYSSLRRIVENVMAHEVAHQFAVSHSWNNCPGSDNQRAGGAAFEPGSGSTIMSYQGGCGAANNVSEIGDNIYYHVGSLQQFENYLGGLGGACADDVPVANNIPVVSAPNIDGRVIPKETPFVLTGSATDEDGDELLYNWEQYDLGNALPLCEQSEDSPLFRSLPPTRRGNTRYFPKLEDVLFDRTDCEEQLPRFGRDLTFRLTARDRNPVGGGTAWTQVGMRVDGDAGPFRVTSQNSAATTYASGEFVTVTWDVANTNAGAVNATAVDILLSTDGGFSFPTVLATATNNDGSEGVLLPDIETTNARIMVRPVDNVFYAVSESIFTIVTPTVPTFTFAPSASTVFLCLPDTASVELSTGSLLNFDAAITLSIEGELPEGLTATIDDPTLEPGESTRLRFDFSDFNRTEEVFVDIRASAEGTDDAVRRILLDLVSNDFSDLRLVSPANGEAGLSGLPTFVFEESQAADSYTIQVSTEPNFGFGTFELNDPDPSGDELGFLLAPNTVYFWRVVSENRCGEDYTGPINAFHTFAAECKQFGSDRSFGIPANSTSDVVIPVPVAESGAVNDINVPLVDVRFGGGINNLRVILESPQGTSVRLYSRRCAGGQLLSGYDDEAPLDNNCTPPPFDGALRKPADPLSRFNGEDVNGEWKLKLEIVEASPGGGEFRKFDLEFCANITSQAPTLTINEVPVPQGGKQFLLRQFLNAEDPDNSQDDLTYIIVDTPRTGHLERYGERMEIGDRFTQGEAANYVITYVDDANVVGTDRMTIVLSDNAGNIIATPEVIFDIDPNNVTGVEEEATVAMFLAPNPTGSWSRLRFERPSEGGEVTILDAQGRRVTQSTVAVGQTEVDIDASYLPTGIYLVSYRGAEGARTMRLVRQ